MEHTTMEALTIPRRLPVLTFTTRKSTKFSEEMTELTPHKTPPSRKIINNNKF